MVEFVQELKRRLMIFNNNIHLRLPPNLLASEGSLQFEHRRDKFGLKAAFCAFPPVSSADFQGQRVDGGPRRVTRALSERRVVLSESASGACAFDGFVREADMAERQAARLVELARRSYRRMHATCKADINPLFPTARMTRKPIVELAKQFGLLPERPKPTGLVAFGRLYEKSDEEVSHDLINPLFYFDKAAVALKQGFVKARSGQELRIEAAIDMFENYLGIAQRREQAATAVKNLHLERRERRAARRLQSRKIIVDKLMIAIAKTQAARIQEIKRVGIEEYGFDAVEVEKCIDIIEKLAAIGPLADPVLQMMVRRHTSLRKGRPDFNRFMADVVERATEHAERVRARKRIHSPQARDPPAPGCQALARAGLDARLPVVAPYHALKAASGSPAPVSASPTPLARPMGPRTLGADRSGPSGSIRPPSPPQASKQGVECAYRF